MLGPVRVNSWVMGHSSLRSPLRRPRAVPQEPQPCTLSQGTGAKGGATGIGCAMKLGLVTELCTLESSAE